MTEVSVQLVQAKAEFFRTLGHPVRIQVLELLQDGPKPVRDLLAAIEIEPPQPVAAVGGAAPLGHRHGDAGRSGTGRPSCTSWRAGTWRS